MPPYVVFDAQKFLEEVAKVKKFWLHTKLNKLRIETNRSESTISLYSIHKASGLETAVTIPAYISADCIMTIGTVNSFYNAVVELQKLNVGPGTVLDYNLFQAFSNLSIFASRSSNQDLTLLVHIHKNRMAYGNLF